MRRMKGLGSVLLAMSLVVTQLPINGAVTASAEEKEQTLAYEYEAIGNTGAVIEVADATGVTATVADDSIATTIVSGNTITVTGKEDAVGIAKVLIGYGDDKTSEVEVPIGYTTFLFDGDKLKVYEGEDTKYEISRRYYGGYQVVDDTLEYEEENVEGTTLSDDSVLFENTVSGNVCVNIKKKGGTYVFAGQADDMSISVNKEATGAANLLLAGLDLSSSFTSPVTVKKNSLDTASVTITALAGHTNTLSDAVTNNADIYGDPTEDGGDGTNTEFAESAVIKAKAAAKLTLNGAGTLKLNCASKNAVKVGEEGYLVVDGLNLQVTSTGHGLSSDNTLEIKSGNISIDAASDAVRSDPDAVDATAGCAGTITISGRYNRFGCRF